MSTTQQQARIAALSLQHGTAFVQLLRANDRLEHASNLEAALREVAEIVCREVGRNALAEAVRWAYSRADGPEPDPVVSGRPH